MEEENINLMDYIKIIIKKKTLILSFLLASLIIAGGLTFLLPKTYKAETYLKIGSEESPSNTAEEINAGFFGDYPGIEATNILGVGLVKVETVSKDPDRARKNLENINKSILEKESQEIAVKKKYLKSAIERLDKKIKFLLYKNNEVAPLELKIFGIQKQIDNMHLTKIIKKPVIISEGKANLIFNLICGGLLGLFLGVFLVFGINWWEKNRKEL